MSRAIALLAATVAGLAAGAVPTGSAVTAAADEVGLALTAQAFTVAPGRSWTATFAVSGDLGAATPTTATTTPATTPGTAPAPVTTVPSTTTAPGPAVEARVVAHRAVSDPLALATVFDGTPTTVVSRATVPVTLTSDGDETSFTLTVPTVTDSDEVDGDDEGTLVLTGAGVYPVTVELLIDGRSVAAHNTLFDRLPATPPAQHAPMDVAVLADVIDPGPTPTAADVARGRDQLQTIAATAGSLGGALTLRVPPAILEQLADDQPDVWNAIRTALAGSEVLSVPAPSLDPSSATAAGLQDVFSRALRSGEDRLSAVLPSPPQRSGWVAESAISTSAAAMLRDPLGFDLVVLEPDVYNELEGSIGGYHDPTLTTTVELGGGAALPGFVISPSSHWLDRADLDRRRLTATDGAVRLMADLVVRQAADPDLRRGIVLAPDPGVAPDPEVAATLASYIAETPDFALTRLTALPATTETMVVPGRGPESVRLPETAGPDLGARVENVNLARLAATSAASMLANGNRFDEWSAELDELLSTGVSDRAATAVLDRINGEVRAMFAAVKAPRPFTFTLTGRRSTLRLNIRNDGAEALNVVVRPSSPKLRFPEGDVPVTLAPNAATEVLIPVQAQTNGTSAIGIEIVTPVGAQTVQGPVVLTARVNALSGLGQVVTGGALLVLVSWWYGHFRRRRRKRRALLGEVDNPPPATLSTLSPAAATGVDGNGASGATAPVADNVSDP
jgi:hypothetical protein